MGVKRLLRGMANLPPDPPRSLRGAPHNPGLQKLIEAKREWHYRPTFEDLRRGFRGWYERGYLPHFDAPNVTQIVTFMLQDAFPVWRRREWEPILKESDLSLRRRKLEAWLDRGHGECWLRQVGVARRVEEILRAEEGKTYRLQAWVVMPNHIHLVVDVWQTPLCTLLAHWKGRSAHDANLLLGRRGTFWQPESFDTRVRDGDHLARAIRYTEHNPTKARLVRDVKDWPWSSAKLRDQYNRLPWQTTVRAEGP
jgi:REP element-mobilizing transposase RayT